MVRFELDCVYNQGTTAYGSYKNWNPTPAERVLIDWLRKNLGDMRGYNYSIPCKGVGWAIVLGYDGDNDIEDWSWRYQMGCTYKPKGRFGHWLQIDDDAKAMELRLNGVLDPCLWSGTTHHQDTSVSHARRILDPDNYPEYRFRRK